MSYANTIFNMHSNNHNSNNNNGDDDYDSMNIVPENNISLDGSNELVKNMVDNMTMLYDKSSDNIDGISDYYKWVSILGLELICIGLSIVFSHDFSTFGILLSICTLVTGSLIYYTDVRHHLKSKHKAFGYPKMSFKNESPSFYLMYNEILKLGMIHIVAICAILLGSSNRSNVIVVLILYFFFLLLGIILIVLYCKNIKRIVKTSTKSSTDSL